MSKPVPPSHAAAGAAALLVPAAWPWALGMVAANHS
jgi:hypothetical protein